MWHARVTRVAYQGDLCGMPALCAACIWLGGPGCAAAVEVGGWQQRVIQSAHCATQVHLTGRVDM